MTMDVYTFGKALLDENDLDPLYVMIHECEMSREEKARYILAYLCFYNTGTASWITDGGSDSSFWDRMIAAADTDIHPRGSDRRHYRGENGRRSVREIKALGLSPSQLFDSLGCRGAISFPALMGRIQRWRGFGPTVAFKAADMTECLWGVRVIHQRSDALLMSEAPRGGAEALAAQEGYTGGKVPLYASNALLSRLGHYLAPPLYERRLTAVETETILCKWKHHLGGTYLIGKGKSSQLKGLMMYPKSPTACRMIEAGRRAGLWA